MNAEQFSKYLSLIDHPTQLNLAVDEQSLFFLYKQHLSRFPYQNVHLYNGEQVADLEIDANLSYMAEFGGHCYQQSELLIAALEHVGFNVNRVASWVLMGGAYQEGMPVNHNILLVTIKEKHFLCDPGLASASPRYPLCVSLTSTEEVNPCEGDYYKLEVVDDHYNLYWKMKGEYFLLYRIPRDSNTKLPKICDKAKTLQMCQDVYTVPDCIPIRDVYVKVSKQWNDGVYSFMYVGGNYNFKVIQRGKPIENRDIDFKEFFQLIKKYCNIQFDEEPVKQK